MESGKIEVSGSDSESVSGAKSTSKDVTIGQNGYTQYLQAFAQYPALRGSLNTQSTSQEPYSFLKSSLFSYNKRGVISDIDTEEHK